jgi:hypothetical protein
MHVKGEEKWIDKIGLIVDWIRAIYMLNQNKLIMGESQELYITGCIYSFTKHKAHGSYWLSKYLNHGPCLGP